MTPADFAAERARFERWIAAPPFERETRRFANDPERVAWPGQYLDLAVDLAWRAWLEAIDTGAGAHSLQESEREHGSRQDRSD